MRFIGDTVTLAPGIVVSDGDIRAAGGDPAAVRSALAQPTPVSARLGPAIAVGKAATAGVQTNVSSCIKADRAEASGAPVAIVRALRAKCAAESTNVATGSAGAEDAPSSGGPSPVLIAVAVAAVAGVAFVLLRKKKGKRK